MYQILYRKGADHIRHKQLHRNIYQEFDRETCNKPADEQGNTHFIQFDRLIARLDPNGYQVIHLHYLEGLDINDIASVLKLPKGTVKSRLFNARKQLKKFIEEEVHE